MHKSATKCNETLGKWCKNKHGASKIIDTLETYHSTSKMKRKSDAPDSDVVGSKKHKHASVAENSTGMVADDNAHVMPDAVASEI
jgi:hypothetical protein